MRNSASVVREVRRIEDQRGVPVWWDDLFEVSYNRSIFLSSTWLATWLEVYGHDFSGHWLRWESEGSVVAGCLILTRMLQFSGFGLSSIFLNATGVASDRTPYAEFNDVLCVRGFEGLVATDLADFLRGIRWSRFEISGVGEDALIRRVVPLLDTSGSEKEIKGAPYVDFSLLAGQRFQDSLSSRRRAQLRKTSQQYINESGPILLTRPRNVDEASVFLETLINFSNLRWRSKGVVGSFSSESICKFHRRLVVRLWPKGLVDIVRVSSGNREIGYLYNFCLDGKVYHFQSGYSYDHKTAWLQPGFVTIVTAVEDYWGNGYREFDFLAGDSQYKHQLANNRRLLVWSVVYRRNLMGYVFRLGKQLRANVRRMWHRCSGSG